MTWLHSNQSSSLLMSESSELEEAKRTIVQLKQQLAATEQLLQQERAAREYAERAAQQAANAAEVAARAAVEASRHHSIPAPAAIQRYKLFTRTESSDFEMEDVSDPQPRSREHASAPIPKKSLGSIEAQPASVSSKARGVGKKASGPSTNNGQKMSLVEVRRAVQEETERRMQERAKVFSSKK